MAITTDRIDGQNTGLRFTAPDVAANVLTVNMTTGAATSSYLSTGDLQVIRSAALDLFALVPLAERLSGALGFLQRLVSVAAADNSSITPTANVVGNNATLVVTVAAAPANIIIHVPFTSGGAVAWASGITTGGGGGSVVSVGASTPIASSGGSAPTISINDSGVVAGSYGSATTVPVVTVSAKGLVSSVVNTPITFPSAVTNVTASSPLSSTGGATPDISLGTSGVVAGAYGSATSVPVVTVSDKGLVSNAVNTPITFPVTGVSVDAPITSTGGAAPTLGLADTAVTPGTYGSAAATPESKLATFTVDAKGRLTAAAEAAIQIGGSAAKAYVDAQDAATLASAQSYAQGLAFNISSKDPAHAATTVALPSYTVDGTFKILTATVNGALPLIDGHTLAVTERLLVKNEAGANEPNNGLYSVTQLGDGSNPWILTRTSDADSASELCGAMVPIEVGTVNGGTVWLFSANSSTFVLGTTNVVWTPLSVGAATVSTLGTVQLAAGLGGTGTSAAAPKLDADHIVSGTLAVARGGTGATSTPSNGQLLIGNGTGYTVAALTAGSGVSITNGAGSISIAATATGLTNWTEAVNTSAPNATVPVTSFTATNAATDVDAALVAKGTGATLAQIPDAGFSGGDKRGTAATDWQKVRLSASQVASGASATVSGGARNTASGQESTVVGGFNNTASGERSIAGGASSTASGLNSVALGTQNNVTTAYSTAVGTNNSATGNNASAYGYNNTASGPSSFAAGTGSTASADTAVALGAGTASGNFSLAIGIGNVANNSVSASVGGQNNYATGQWALAAGGIAGTASGNYSGTLAGFGAIANSYAQLSGGAYPHGFSGTDGTSLVLTDPLLTLGNGTGAGASASNALTLLKDGSLGLGLGQNKPTERLHVAGNVRFSGALLPNDLAGTSGQVLTSAGAGVAPTWNTPPSSGPDAGQRQPAIARYDFAGTAAPSVPTAPSAPTFSGTEYFVGSSGGDYATLALAVAAASPGDIITVRAGYTTTETPLTTVNVNKSLEIRGEDRSTSVVTGVAGSAGGNFLITIGAGVNDVWIHDLTITNNVTAAQDPGGISSNIAATGMTQTFPSGSTGLRFERLTLNHWKFGINVQGAGFVINDCSFACTSTTPGTTIRHIGHYGQTGTCFITNCVMTPTTDATPRSQGIYMTTNFPGVGTYRPGQVGNLIVQNLTQSGSGNWNAYYLQDVLHEPGAATGSGYDNPATPGSFSLYFDNVNFTTSYSGNSLSVVEATGTIAPLSFFATLYFNNCVGQARTTGDNKGFFAVAGSTGTGRSIGAPTVGFWVQGSNTFNSTIPSATYAEGSTVDNLLGVLTTNFAVPSPLLSPTVPVYVPSGTLTADGVALNVSDRVFLFNTSDPTYSGLYSVASGTWTRVTDMAAAANAAGFFWWVLNGATYGNTGWVVSSASGGAVVGTNSLSFRRFGGLGGESYTVGNATHWTAPAPTNVWAALDRLAAAVAGLLAGPIP